MPHHTLKGVVCKGARALDVQDTTPHLSVEFSVKYLDIIKAYKDGFLEISMVNERKLKIAYVCPFYTPAIGGVKQVVEELSKQYVKQGHEIHVFTSDWD
ncbi:hypothetical protein COV15_03150, partial [Candidatus Woesearchaeota archaeon CG10_big_fil_rev_8_21_14_0_10_34_12]